MGRLTPVMITEAIPSDKFIIGAEALIRFAPLIAPVMHRFDVSIHYFFVPNRIVWPNWENFITGRDESVVFPTIEATNSSLVNYMGLPGDGAPVSAIPFAAYQMIYNEYYRDQNLIDPVDFILTDGDNSSNTQLTQMRQRAWEHDYYTSSLPTAQAGTAVDIPLGEVTLKTDWENEGSPRFRSEFDNLPKSGDVNSNTTDPFITVPDGDAFKQAYDPDGTMEVQPTTITDLRRAFKLQEWLELSMRAGKRLTETIYAFFGVKNPDSRLQRPEYITGIKSPVVISEVLNTTGEDAGLPQGNMAGHGVSVAQGKFGSYYVQEHGYIIGIMSIRPKTAYVYNTAKHWLKFNDRFQYFWPQFAHIGEQEVLNREVKDDHAQPNGVFGYVPRYAEYRFEHNRVSGEFRTTLNYWHLARLFETDPALNQQFVECVPGNRIFAVTTGDNLFCHVLNKVTAIRPIPKWGNPMM